ncbi:uncharacterized protein DNG_05382 [Cephalotrichum gorgonifer]|uniref:C2H2-type domain-containing protein n=1 Tax=Cephalotrichum gorgonifer TaxID=2041049 RepID=A0AAE8MY77_9PEZI|nr:uncharacterized protein DNG_05382 [Cephalotrichum gorgonifer]
MSPGGIRTRELQSPLRPPALCSPFYVTPSASSDTTTPLPRLVGDYGRNSTESPNDQSGPSAADSSGGANDGAGTEIGTFKCSFEGCQARPFQTQYLLNSHANVHSAERPHYCSVMGCPRSKAGKGFKRKNEMIRHGFVHKSPGYACPFCPDREHKYPRPDNLQRHVRSRHVEVDKNDSRLLEVLAQRPDGPSRGRRRRTLPA